MGMHVRNLEPGEVFHGPRDLWRLNDEDYPDNEVRWRVVYVKRDENTRYYHFWVNVAEVGKPWVRAKALLLGDISLCEDNDYIRPRTRLKWAARGAADRALKLLPDEVYFALFPGRRPGRRALLNAIVMAGPVGQLCRALEAGNYNAAPTKLENGCSLVVEDLEAVFTSVTFDTTKIKFSKENAA